MWVLVLIFSLQDVRTIEFNSLDKCEKARSYFETTITQKKNWEGKTIRRQEDFTSICVEK